MTLIIDIHQAEGNDQVTIIAPNGRIDTSNYAILLDKAADLVQKHPTHILMDLHHAPFISSAGLAVLQSISSLLRGANNTKKLKLCRPQPSVERALRIVGYDMIMEIYNDLDEAVASFA